MLDPPSIVLKVLGDAPIIKILDFLLIHREFDYSMTQIAEYAEVSYSTLKKLWPHLIANGIVKQTRKVGKAKMFTLDMNTPFVMEFNRFTWAVVNAEVKKDLGDATDKRREALVEP